MKKISLSLLLCSVSFLTTAHAMDDEQGSRKSAPIKLQKQEDQDNNNNNNTPSLGFKLPVNSEEKAKTWMTAEGFLGAVSDRHQRAKPNEKQSNFITNTHNKFLNGEISLGDYYNAIDKAAKKKIIMGGHAASMKAILGPIAKEHNSVKAPVKELSAMSIEDNNNVALTAENLLQNVQAKHGRARINENEKNEITRLYNEYVNAGKTIEAAQLFSNKMQSICEEGKTRELSDNIRFHHMFAKDMREILGLPESTNRAPLKRSMELNAENWKSTALKTTSLASEQEKLQSIFKEYEEKKDETLLLNALDGTINKGLKRHTAQAMKEAFFPEHARKDKEFQDFKTRSLVSNSKNNYQLFKNLSEFGIDTAIKNSKIISLHDSKPDAAPVEKFETKFEFTTETTAEAIKDLHKANPDGKIGVLDCANASTPGGGYRRGGNAQEEALMQVTTGYPVLTGIWPDDLFDGKIAVLNGVQLIKEAKENFKFELLRKEDRISFTMIAQAARNLNGREMSKLSPEAQVKKRNELQNETISYMEAQIRAFKESGCTDIILNAFGGGSFGNDNNAIAAEYIRILKMDEFKGAFRTVRFANPGKEINALYEAAFKNAFGAQVTTNLSGNSDNNSNKN